MCSLPDHGCIWVQAIPGALSESTAGMKPDPGSCSQAVRPQAISDLVLAAERMRFPADSKQMQAKPGSCTRCSYISSQPICKVRSSSNGPEMSGLGRCMVMLGAAGWCCSTGPSALFQVACKPCGQAGLQLDQRHGESRSRERMYADARLACRLVCCWRA